MSLDWTLDTEKRLMVAVATGNVTRLQVDAYLDAIIANDALSYRKVFDASQGDTSMTADDVLSLAVRMRSVQDLGQLGALVIILPPRRGERLRRVFGILAVAKRPMRIFEDSAQAFRWIAKQTAD